MCTIISVHGDDGSDFHDSNWFCPGRGLVQEDVRNSEDYPEKDKVDVHL